MEKLEDLLTKDEKLTAKDFEYLTRPNRSQDDKNSIKTVAFYMHSVMPEFEEESKNKIDYLRGLVEECDFMALENFYNKSLEYYLEKDKSVQKFNVIFVHLLCLAAGILE